MVSNDLVNMLSCHKKFTYIPIHTLRPYRAILLCTTHGSSARDVMVDICYACVGEGLRTGTHWSHQCETIQTRQTPRCTFEASYVNCAKLDIVSRGIVGAWWALHVGYSTGGSKRRNSEKEGGLQSQELAKDENETQALRGR